MSLIRPPVFPRFATLDLNNGTGGAPNVVEPSSGKKDSGWNEGERPPRETFNWLHRITFDWIDYLDDVVEGTQFAQDVDATTGLSFVVGPGKATVRGDETGTVANTVLALVDDAVNFVIYRPSTNTVVFFDEIGSPTELLGGKNVIPLFRVTTVAGAITVIDDLRTWLVMPSIEHSELDQHEIRTAGQTFKRVSLSGATPVPDVALSNVFRMFIDSDNVTMQDAINVELLSSTSVDIIYFEIEFQDGATGSLVWSSQYDFLSRVGIGNGNLVPRMGGGSNENEFVIKAVWDADNNTFRCEIIGGIAGLSGRQGCLAFRNSAQLNTTSNIDTAVLFNDETFDYGGVDEPIHSTSVNTSRLTVPRGVTQVRLRGGVIWENNQNAGRRLRIRKDGGLGSIDLGITGAFIPTVSTQPSGNQLFEASLQVESGSITVAEGDFFELYAFQNSGASLDLLANQCWFEMEILG